MTGLATYQRILDAAEGAAWEPNEHGLWCPHCGEIIAPDWFFERDETFEPPTSCRQCGFPEFGS